LQKAQANIHLCHDCDYLFAAKPDWLADAYDRVINTLDTGCLARTESMRDQTALSLYLSGGRHGRWLDYGGGHGSYVRRMRDAGFDFRWHDPMAENLFAVGFEAQIGEKFHGVTCFECVEHFTDPLAEFHKMIPHEAPIFFSTELHPERIPPPESWWYYALEHGQHVGFHSPKSLTVLAKTLGLSLVSSWGCLHAFLPPEEVAEPAAHLISRGGLPLSAWAWPSLRGIFSAKVFFRSLFRRKIVSRDLVDALEKMLGSKTWPDHVSLKKKMARVRD